VETKLFSFYYYLTSVNHRGYGRWTLLNQAVKEIHPQELSLLDVMKNKDQNGDLADEVFLGLKKFFSEKFLALSMNEEIQLQHRQLEYKDLMKKALMLSHMMMNINPKNIKVTLNVYFWL